MCRQFGKWKKNRLEEAVTKAKEYIKKYKLVSRVHPAVAKALKDMLGIRDSDHLDKSSSSKLGEEAQEQEAASETEQEIPPNAAKTKDEDQVASKPKKPRVQKSCR